MSCTVLTDLARAGAIVGSILASSAAGAAAPTPDNLTYSVSIAACVGGTCQAPIAGCFKFGASGAVVDANGSVLNYVDNPVGKKGTWIATTTIAQAGTVGTGLSLSGTSSAKTMTATGYAPDDHIVFAITGVKDPACGAGAKAGLTAFR